MVHNRPSQRIHGLVMTRFPSGCIGIMLDRGGNGGFVSSHDRIVTAYSKSVLRDQWSFFNGHHMKTYSSLDENHIHR
jgi:hypothetical protein